MIELKSVEQFDELVKGSKPVLVDFGATWCGPCRMLKPELEELSEETNEFEIVSVDVDEFGVLAGRHNVNAVPTLFLYKEGKVLAVSAGYKPKASILKFVKEHL